MAATLGAPSFDSPALKPRKQRRAARHGLRWAVVVMVLLNLMVWGGMIAAMAGLMDLNHIL